ncbi:hypothetical protein EJ07DRAFT_25896, partial [Lizonia empirigonia]
DDTNSLPPLTLEQVLTIFLWCFEAAIEALPLYPLILKDTRFLPASCLSGLPPGLKVWEFALDYSAAPCLVKDYNINALPAPLQEVHQALRKKNVCDYFCLLLESALRAKLEELHLGTARWICFQPLARTLYVEVFPDQDTPTSHLHPASVRPPMHSVLEIIAANGEELIVDGTPEQFGWDSQARINIKEEIRECFVQRVEGQAEFRYRDEAEKKYIKEFVADGDRDEGLWKELCSRMTELLEELDWDSFRGVSEIEMREQVMHQARRKF